MKKITDYAREYAEARKIKEEAEKVLAEAKESMLAAEAALFSAMVDDEIDSISYGGKTYRPQIKTYYSCPADKKQELFIALREDGLGDIIKEDVNANTLSSAMREVVEQNGGEVPEEYADLVNVYDKQTIVARKA